MRPRASALSVVGQTQSTSATRAVTYNGSISISAPPTTARCAAAPGIVCPRCLGYWQPFWYYCKVSTCMTAAPCLMHPIGDTPFPRGASAKFERCMKRLKLCYTCLLWQQCSHSVTPEVVRHLPSRLCCRSACRSITQCRQQAPREKEQNAGCRKHVVRGCFTSMRP